MDVRADAHEAGSVPDPVTGRSFWAAAAALATTAAGSARRALAAEAGEALVALAATGPAAAVELRDLLSPDPSNANVTWSVACYQVGDLTPSALADFAEPLEAMATLVGCDQSHHVAAELVASTSSGLRWTALVRTNQRVAFQIPDAETAVDSSHAHAGELADALQRWWARMAQGSKGAVTAPTDGCDPVDAWAPSTVAPRVAPIATVPGSPAMLVAPILPPAAVGDHGSGNGTWADGSDASLVAAAVADGRVTDRLAALERAVTTVAALAQQVASAGDRVDERLATIEGHLAVAAHRDERTLRALDRIAEGVARHEAAVADLGATVGSPALWRDVPSELPAVAEHLDDVDTRIVAILPGPPGGAAVAVLAGALRAVADDIAADRAARTALTGDVQAIGGVLRALCEAVDPALVDGGVRALR